MPTYQTAKQIAENSLSTIGAFPASMSQVDAGELRKTLKWMEMILNQQTGIRVTAGFWLTVDIPLEAGIGDYTLSDYVDEAATQQVFSVGIFDSSNTQPDPLILLFESDAAFEDLGDTGKPRRCVITRDVHPVLRVFPEPTQDNEDAGMKIRVRIQTFHAAIDHTGIGDEDLMIRPSWYLWLTKRTAYEIGCGPVRRLAEGELKRLQDDADKTESMLLARDGMNNSGRPPVTEPMEGTVF